MKAMILAVGVVFLLSLGSSAKSAQEAWAKPKTTARVRGMAAVHRPAVRSSGLSGMTGSSVVPQYASSNLPAFGSGASAGPSMGTTVQPLRPMARSRTTGSGVFVAGAPVLGNGAYTTQQTFSRLSSTGGGYAITAGKGGSLSGPGVTKAKAPDGASAAGTDPLSKILTGIANIFGDMANMLGGGGTGGG